MFEFKGKNNPKIVSPEGEVLKYYRTKSDLADPDTFDHFVKQCEKKVRDDPRYKNYISELLQLGYTKDVFQSEIDKMRFPNTKLEMHHGPLFTMYNICAIVTDHLLNTDNVVNTFEVAKIVLREHELGRIQVVMGLTETNHQLVHNGDMFVHMNMAIGDVLGFIGDFRKGILPEHLYTMEEYLQLCKKYEATDNDFLLLRGAATLALQCVDKNK